eukprot:937148_1
MCTRIRNYILILLIVATLRVWIFYSDLRGYNTGTIRPMVLIQINVLLSHYNLFKGCTRFDPLVFVCRLYRPLEPHLNEPCDTLNVGVRRYIHNVIGVRRRSRRRAIGKFARLTRCTMHYSGWNRWSLTVLFGQSISATNKDIRFISKLIVTHLHSIYVDRLIPGSWKYNILRGSGVLYPHWPRAVYIIDVIKIKIQRPHFTQRMWYDGHKKYHCVGYIVITDGFGVPHLIYGPQAGRDPDLTILRHAGLDRIGAVVLEGDSIIGDRIFRWLGAPYLCHFTGYNYYNVFELFFNFYLSKSRVIVENFFARTKTLWPAIEYYKGKLENADYSIRSAFIMTSIIIQHQDPLRV